MKIDRLLSIVILLLNRPLIQAKELADMFEVSVRTIYRDIDSINSAGIPVVTFQGSGAASASCRATGWTAMCYRNASWPIYSVRCKAPPLSEERVTSY